MAFFLFLLESWDRAREATKQDIDRRPDLGRKVILDPEIGNNQTSPVGAGRAILLHYCELGVTVGEMIGQSIRPDSLGDQTECPRVTDLLSLRPSQANMAMTITSYWMKSRQASVMTQGAMSCLSIQGNRPLTTWVCSTYPQPIPSSHRHRSR